MNALLTALSVAWPPFSAALVIVLAFSFLMSFLNRKAQATDSGYAPFEQVFGLALVFGFYGVTLGFLLGAIFDKVLSTILSIVAAIATTGIGLLIGKDAQAGARTPMATALAVFFVMLIIGAQYSHAAH